MASDIDIYKTQNFGNRLGFGEKAALLIVDFVNGFTDPAKFGGGNIQEAIDATVGLLAFCRGRGVPVAHTRVIFADDAADANIMCMKVPALTGLTEDAPESQIVDALEPRPGGDRRSQAGALGLLRHRPRASLRQDAYRHGDGRGLHHLRLRPRERARRHVPRLPPSGDKRLRRRPGRSGPTRPTSSTWPRSMRTLSRAQTRSPRSPAPSRRTRPSSDPP